MGRTDNEEAIAKAINDFWDTEIMGPFLKKHANEVLNMLTSEWNISDFGRVQREEGRKEGYEQGRQEGLADKITTLSKSINSLIENTGKSFDEVVVMMGLSDEYIATCRSNCQK